MGTPEDILEDIFKDGRHLPETTDIKFAKLLINYQEAISLSCFGGKTFKKKKGVDSVGLYMPNRQNSYVAIYFKDVKHGSKKTRKAIEVIFFDDEIDSKNRYDPRVGKPPHFPGGDNMKVVTPMPTFGDHIYTIHMVNMRCTKSRYTSYRYILVDQQPKNLSEENTQNTSSDENENIESFKKSVKDYMDPIKSQHERIMSKIKFLEKNLHFLDDEPELAAEVNAEIKRYRDSIEEPSNFNDKQSNNHEKRPGKKAKKNTYDEEIIYGQLLVDQHSELVDVNNQVQETEVEV